MPFILYRRERAESGSRLVRLRDVQLAGDGPLKSVSGAATSPDGTPRGWHATEAEILRQIGVVPEQHSIIIDLKPRQKGYVSLYRLRDVWGYSYEEWTPLALRLECLFVDVVHDDPPTFKREFPEPDVEGALIGEFLYVQGGTHGGSWNWGMVGRVNGALLWPDAFAYLSGNLGEALSASSS